MYVHDFIYHRAGSVEEAVRLMGEAEEGRYLAGGQTLVQTMKQKLAMSSDVIDLGGIAELRKISAQGDTVQIGSMIRHAEVAQTPLVLERIPGLAGLAAGIGDRQVRNMGTLGGSVANSDPAADYPAAVLGLDAVVVTDSREIEAGDFFVDLYETALEEGELIVAIRFRVPMRSAYYKFRHPASSFAMVGAFVAQFPDGFRVAVTGARPTVFRWQAAEAALQAVASPEAVAQLDTDGIEDILSDMHCDETYRRRLMPVAVRRALDAMNAPDKETD